MSESRSNEFRYWAFISYSHSDERWGNWLHRSLESYRVPRRLVGRKVEMGAVPRRVSPVFRDREELSAASELSDEIQAALDSSRFLIVICSVASAKSHWVNEEIRYFKSRAGSKRVLAVIVNGEPNAWDGSHECFPPAIKFHVSASGEMTDSPTEPIAADARRQGDGKFNAKLKTLAGLLGVKYDELRRREQLRARRKLAAWGMAVSIVCCALLAMFSYSHGSSLVRELQTADTSQVATVIQSLQYSPLGRMQLRPAFDESDDASDAKLHIALALAGRDETGTVFLRDRILSVPVEKFPHLRDQLAQSSNQLVDYFWTVASDTGQPEHRRNLAVCFLAGYDSSNAQWENEELQTFVVDRLVHSVPSEFGIWLDALRGAKHWLVDALLAIYTDQAQRQAVRRTAANALAEYLKDDPTRLFGMLAHAQDDRFEMVVSRLMEHPEQTLELAKAAVSGQVDLRQSDSDRDIAARLQANAAVVLMRLQRADLAWQLLRHTPDPSARSYFVDWVGQREQDSTAMISGLRELDDTAIRRAIVLGLGQFDETAFTPEQKATLVAELMVLFRNERDAGLHSAAEWLLEKWGHRDALKEAISELRQDRFTEDELKHTQWYVNSQEQTMVVLDIGEFVMGSPLPEAGRSDYAEGRRRVSVYRRVAVASKEVTVEEFQRYNPRYSHSAISRRSPTVDSPAAGISWFAAVDYCNWLSEVEGIAPEQHCYTTDSNGNFIPRTDYLTLSGYRLPTGAEWEFACRASAVTSRYYGETTLLLDRYAHMSFLDELNRPVGSLKPNDFGMFDMLGNAWEWCDDRYSGRPDRQPLPQLTDTGWLGDGDPRRITRGGSCDEPPKRLRSAYRSKPRFPASDDVDLGFRIVRTLAGISDSDR